MANHMNGIFEVLSPWAEADPIPLKGLSPRLDVLSGKKIGLLQNNKRAAEPVLNTIQTKLKERFPDIEFSRIKANTFSISDLEPERQQELVDWISSVDAVIAAVAD